MIKTRSIVLCHTPTIKLNRLNDKEEKWHHEHLDAKHSSYRETQQIELFILGIQDAPIPCQPRLLELYWRNTRISTQPNTHRLPSIGTSSKPCAVLSSIMRSWSHARLYPRGQNAKRGAWEPQKDFATNTIVRKLQFRQELNNIEQRDMSINNYTFKIKELCDSFGSINVYIDDDEMV